MSTALCAQQLAVVGVAQLHAAPRKCFFGDSDPKSRGESAVVFTGLFDLVHSHVGPVDGCDDEERLALGSSLGASIIESKTALAPLAAAENEGSSPSPAQL